VVDRWFFTALIVLGLWFLHRKKFDWFSAVGRNPWLSLLCGLMLVSILWSNYPAVSFKRLVKSFGAIVMALLVLSEGRFIDSILTVLRRGAYLLIPLSIVVIRYFRNIGISWDWAGETEAWVGVATSKNTLGQLAMTAVIVFVIELLRNRQAGTRRWIDLAYLGMSVYLLKGSDDAFSMTSVSVTAVALGTFLLAGYLRAHPALTWPLGYLVILLILGLLLSFLDLISGDSVIERVVNAVGRDSTLTGRTEIWADVLAIASRSPIVGVGFGAFWIGRLVNIPWTLHFTWTLGQAHNGYLDTYLQLGWLGIICLSGLILTTVPKIGHAVKEDFEYGRFRLVFFLVILFVNLTESTFLRGDHHLWFIFLLAIISLSRTQERKQGVEGGFHLQGRMNKELRPPAWKGASP